jgi:hypothetical protein
VAPNIEENPPVVVLYLIVLAAALYLMSVSRQRGLGARRGWLWFNAWVAAGALFLFSLLTGFSIGLFLCRPRRSRSSGWRSMRRTGAKLPAFCSA